MKTKDNSIKINNVEHVASKIYKESTATTITVNFDLNGVHNWGNCDIDTVNFLKYIHHHNFNFIIEVQVFHNDRELEFIKVQSEVMNFLCNRYPNYKNLVALDFSGQSCEMLATEILDFILSKYGTRTCKISVGEDGKYFGNIYYNVEEIKQ